MKLYELLRTDLRVQQTVRDLSQNLGPGECIFALKIPFGYNFKIIPESRKRWFRFVNKPFVPTYITNNALDNNMQVGLIGQVIEIMEREFETVNN
jgi:hypothetical protein